ncbi:hypothetical protein [Rhodosalinus sp. FB01]|uniref:hypothetical protein n=1 Tax=Rhodosalinus sp. FB01 TaxID=3239194 RepID=UPI0035233C63
MALDEFLRELMDQDGQEALRAFCQARVLHGTPYCFTGREDEWFQFKLEISRFFGINHTDVFIAGSAMLGFSPVKRTDFSVESDIDVAIVSPALFGRISDMACELEYSMRDAQLHLPNHQFRAYIRFLRYLAIGWARPDLVPPEREIGAWKREWFDFFKSVSYERCKAGNHKVSAGAFSSYERLERYSLNSFEKIRSTLVAEAQG